LVFLKNTQVNGKEGVLDCAISTNEELFSNFLYISFWSVLVWEKGGKCPAGMIHAMLHDIAGLQKFEQVL